MKKVYLVSFPIGSFWQSNVVLAKDIQSVINHYGKKYGSAYVTEGNDNDLKEAKKKKEPIVELK